MDINVSYVQKNDHDVYCFSLVGGFQCEHVRPIDQLMAFSCNSFGSNHWLKEPVASTSSELIDLQVLRMVKDAL